MIWYEGKSDVDLFEDDLSLRRPPAGDDVRLLFGGAHFAVARKAASANRSLSGPSCSHFCGTNDVLNGENRLWAICERLDYFIAEFNRKDKGQALSRPSKTLFLSPEHCCKSAPTVINPNSVFQSNGTHPPQIAQQAARVGAGGRVGRGGGRARGRGQQIGEGCQNVIGNFRHNSSLQLVLAA